MKFRAPAPHPKRPPNRKFCSERECTNARKPSRILLAFWTRGKSSGSRPDDRFAGPSTHEACSMECSSRTHRCSVWFQSAHKASAPGGSTTPNVVSRTHFRCFRAPLPTGSTTKAEMGAFRLVSDRRFGQGPGYITLAGYLLRF
jgi:hypothetical protein